MSNTFKVLLVAGCLTLTSLAPSLAAASVNARQQRQAARLQAGVASGTLTAREAASLRRATASVRHEERRYRRDGVLQPWERADLQRDLTRLDRALYRQKHDGQVR